jgi:hypothetical protein
MTIGNKRTHGPATRKQSRPWREKNKLDIDRKRAIMGGHLAGIG